MEGGGTLSEIYQSSKRLLLKARDGVERLERLESSTSTGGLDSPELSFAVKKDITQIQSLCVEMDHLWRSVASKHNRDLWKRKVEQVAEEVESLRQGVDKYLARNQRQTIEAKERAELLGRANGESAHILRIFDEESQAMQSVQNYIGSPYYEKKRREFMNLRQGSMTLQEYESEFARLSTYAPELVPTEAIRCERFVYGLEDEIRTAVVAFNDTVFSTLRDRVLRIAESRNRFNGWREFMNLRQGSMTLQEYESEFARLSTYAPELVPTEAIRCERFVYGLEDEIRTAVVAFNDTVFSTLRDRVLRIAESRNRFNGSSDQGKSQFKRPAGSVNDYGFSKKAKEAHHSGRSGSHQSRRSNSEFRQQSSASVVSTGGSAGHRGVPFCDFCKRHHSGVCWRKIGACLRCGSTDHIVRDCPKSSFISAPAQDSAPAARDGQPVGRSVF